MSIRRGRRRTSTIDLVSVVCGACLAVGTACTAATVRPTLRPFPSAVVDTLAARPGALIDAAVELVTRRGFRVARVSAAEGYLETRWLDTRVAPHRVIRLRFFADSVGGARVQVVAEALYRRTLDPSLPAREREAMVPPGAPADSLLLTILDSLRLRFTGAVR